MTSEHVLPPRVLAFSLVLLAVSAGLGFASYFLALGSLDAASAGRDQWTLRAAAFGLVILPCVHPVLRWAEGRWSLRRRNLLSVWMLQAIPILLFPSLPPEYWLLIVVTLLQANLLTHLRLDRAAAWSLALAPTQVLAAMAAAPDRIWLVVFPLSVTVSSSAALFSSWRYAAALLEARAPRAGLKTLESHRTQTSTRTQLYSRLALGLPIGALLLALTLVIYGLLAKLPRPWIEGVRSSTTQEGEAQDTLEANANRRGGDGERLYPDDLRPGGALGKLSHETVMQVAARRWNDPDGVPTDLGQLYLRGLCLDTFTATGLRADSKRTPPALRDEDDGRRDGWTTLNAKGIEPQIRLDIRQEAFRTRARGMPVLFASQPVLAIEAPLVHYDPDATLSMPVAEDAVEVTYSLLIGAERRSAADLAGAEAGGVSGRYLQLPEPSEDLEFIERRSRELVSRARDDYGRVQAVIGYFREGFGYSLKTTDVPGIEGVVNFMRRRKGHCTSFAAASVLLLRSAGIPSRVVTGFLAKNYSSATGLYTVTRRNGHAWIEVHFEGRGWVRFEPTPSKRREAALAASDSGEDEGLASWADDFMSDLSAWAESGAEASYLGQLLDTLARLPSAALATFKRQPWLILPLAALLAAIVWGWRRGSRATLRAHHAKTHAPMDDISRELLEALARVGHRRRRGETLREVSRRDEEERDELGRIVDSLYRARFGATDLSTEEVATTRACISRLRERIRSQVQIRRYC